MASEGNDIRLDGDAVEALAMGMMYEQAPEDPSEAIVVDALTARIGFDPSRIEPARPKVAAMLLCLPDQFLKTGGGGWSFLNACEDKFGRLWTGEHRRVALLFAAGQACGLATCQLPREAWSALPGGMPYYVVDDLACAEVIRKAAS